MTNSSELHAFEARLAKLWPPASWGSVGLLVAVSGGPDSMALLRAVCAIKPTASARVVAAHFNHRLRGADADADEGFVAQAAQELRIPLEVGRWSAGPTQRFPKHGWEAAARQARYRFLAETAAKIGLRLVAVAHTADDQAETILHRILRGTGVGGLAGMRRARPLSEAATLVRPLLSFRRSDVVGYLQDLSQSYRIDASNFDVRRTRNRIRRQLLPQLAQEFNPGVVDALLRLGSLAGEVQSVIHSLVERCAEQCLIESDRESVRLDFRRVRGESPYVLREVLMAVWRRQGWPLREMSYEHWDSLAAIAGPRGQGRVQVFPGEVRAENADGVLRLTIRRSH